MPRAPGASTPGHKLKDGGANPHWTEAPPLPALAGTRAATAGIGTEAVKPLYNNLQPFQSSSQSTCKRRKRQQEGREWRFSTALLLKALWSVRDAQES